MFRSSSFSVVVLALSALGVAGCDNTIENLGNTPTTPTPVNVTETFTGSLGPNGALTHPFTVNTPGTVVATLMEVTPDNTVTLGISLGTWNGTTCQIVLANDKALPGGSVTGNVSSLGTLCLRIYDPEGKLTAISNYSVDVFHP
jgi:hypothetical protein